MSLTLEEVKQRLAERFDEVTLMELLEANSFAIVDAFSDYIEEHIDKFEGMVDDDEAEED